MKTTRRGLFIAVEGIDGSGSTTQAKRLCAYLESIKRKAYYTAEPSSGPIGQLIRQFLKDGNQNHRFLPQILGLLFAADRLHHVEQEIEPHLADGTDVVSDRYFLSSLAYQGLALPESWIEALNMHALHPDVTILVDVKEDMGEERRLARGGTKEVFDDTPIQRQLRDRYLKLAKAHKALIVDGSKSVEAVERRLIEVIEPFIQGR